MIRAVSHLRRNALILHAGDLDRMVIYMTLLKGNFCDGGDGDCDGVGGFGVGGYGVGDGDHCGGVGSGLISSTLLKR